MRIEAKPTKRVDGFIGHRELWLDEPGDSFASTGVRDRTGLAGTYAGRQIEARVRYWVAQDKLRAEFGGAYLDKRKFLRNAANAPSTGDTLYTYLDLTFEC